MAFGWLLPLALPIYATSYGTVFLAAYREHPNQQLKKEFRCQFYTLYHKKVAHLPVYWL